VFTKQAPKRGPENHVSLRLLGLRLDVLPRAVELSANTDDAGLEVDVGPRSA
jgi:hypothetical protein